MPSIHLKHVSFSYAVDDVIDDATLSIGPGWVGVVGVNGSGKTTLLRLISGQLDPSSGSIVTDPTWAMPTLCPQEVGEADEAVHALSTTSDGLSRRILGQLDLDPDQLARWPTLSPGERKRWQIGAALAEEPEILLLDEPTNHLDETARSILANALLRYRGVGLVVSHDRSFLNELTTKTIRVDHGVVELTNGNYETAQAAWKEVEAQQMAAYESLKTEQRKLKRRIADQRRAAETKRAKHKRKLREAAPKDHDASSMEAKSRHVAGEATATRQLRTTRSAADRTAAELASFEMRRDVGRSFFFGYEPPRRSRLLRYQGPLQAGSHLIADEITADVGRDDRVWLRGPNGAGKTTLLEALAEASTLPDDRLFYLRQELSRSAASAILHDLERMPPEQKGRVLSLVAALGVEPERLFTSALPSPGETRKLFMALGMGGGAWCLILDEPTNHLDLLSIERLEEAIAGYPGAVLLVTHDVEFAASTTTTTWRLEDGELK